MNFKQQYINSPLEELIFIIENGKDYNPDCVAAVKEIIVEKKFSKQEIQKTAEEVNKKRIEKQLKSFNAFRDELQLFTSAFLSKKEIKSLYKTCIAAIKSRRDDFEFDVWSYAIGGV